MHETKIKVYMLIVKIILYCQYPGKDLLKKHSVCCYQIDEVIMLSSAKKKDWINNNHNTVKYFK